jgi:predicted Zn-dependent peptidase
VGDVDPESVIAAADKSFGGWQRAEVSRVETPDPPVLTGRRLLFVQRPNSIQSAISLGNFAVRRADPAWYDLLVANTIYGGAFNSRIVRNIREDKGYTYSPFSQFGALARAGFYRFAASVRNDVTAPTLREVYLEVDKLRAEGAGGPELDGVKQYLKGVFVLQTATQAGLTNTLGTVYTFGLPADYLETFRTRVSEVTPDRVKQAAARLLGSDNSVIVIVGDYPSVAAQLAPYGPVTFLDSDGRPTQPPRGAR